MTTDEAKNIVNSRIDIFAEQSKEFRMGVAIGSLWTLMKTDQITYEQMGVIEDEIPQYVKDSLRFRGIAL